MKRLALLITALIAPAASPHHVDAAMIINILQSGSDVVATGSGSLNLADLSLSGGIAATPQVMPAEAVVILGAVPAVLVDTYSGPISGPFPIGPGGQTTFATSGTGDTFGIAALGNTIFVPRGYVSGTALAAVDTFANQTLAGLGLSVGTYRYGFGSGANADSITINVGTAAVPEPASAALLGLGLAAASWFGWSRSRREVS